MSTITDAVFIFRQDKVIKEMLMSEFDALLDGLFDMSELKNQKAQAVYLQIDSHLKVRGLVFFLLGFNQQGQVVAEWNLPLQQLMQSAGRGPDLGAGAIRWVCKSQCTVPWHQESLWDPQQQTLQIISQVVQRNKLGLLEDDGAAAADGIPLLSPTMHKVARNEPPMITPSFNEVQY